LTDVRGNDRVTIHTDGACSGNPGPGGWGVILQWGGHTRELKGGEAHTTNNRMELMAAIVALETLKRRCDVDVHTDSQYLRQGITDWIRGWKRNGCGTPTRSRSRTQICGSDSTPRSTATLCTGIGCVVIPVTISTNAPTNLPARRLPRSEPQRMAKANRTFSAVGRISARARSDEIESRLSRHARACRGHPRLSCGPSARKTWMAGTSPAMTAEKWFDMTGTRSS